MSEVLKFLLSSNVPLLSEDDLDMMATCHQEDWLEWMEKVRSDVTKTSRILNTGL